MWFVRSELWCEALATAADILPSLSINMESPLTARAAAQRDAELNSLRRAATHAFTTLDVCRANTFVAANQGRDVNGMDVTVIGGHAGITILPLLSQIPGAKFSDADREALTKRIQFGGDEVVQAFARAVIARANDGAPTPIKRLVDFERVFVDAHAGAYA